MRIIGGTARGRTLQTTRGTATRPTSDRVREAMFSIIEATLGALDGVNVLDLYAGSGALGLEAVSRGAAGATFVDNQQSCQQVIRQNAQDLGFADQCAVLGMPVRAALRRLEKKQQRFRLVLIDPPYAEDPTPLLEVLSGLQMVPEDGLVVLEHGKTYEPPELIGDWRLVRHKRYGDTWLAFFSGQGA